jgi:hypothetical protein
MLAPKDAIEKARAYLQDVVPDFAALHPKVEEIVRSPDSSQWRVTFFAHAGKAGATLADLLGQRRIEKIVSVSAQDGSLIAVNNPMPVTLAS